VSTISCIYQLNYGSAVMCVRVITAERYMNFCVLQVTDYAIARRIVDLHCHLEESINRMYTAEDIQRYITFARQFKPRVSVSPTV